MAQLQSLADAPNTLREYETIYILSPNTLNDKVAEVNDRVKTIIEERGGQVLNVDNWGKRKLAYEIKKERKGIYLFWQYLGNADIIAEFERNMRMMDPVMRYMTIKLDNNVVSGSRESSIDGETYEKAAATAADEEELMMKRSSEGEGEGSTEASAEGTTEASAEGTTEASAEGTTEASAEGSEDAVAAAASDDAKDESAAEAAPAAAADADADADEEAPAADKAEASPSTTDEEK